MTPVLVDSNVILDMLIHDERWSAWSLRQLRDVGLQSRLIINPVIFAEVSVGISTMDLAEQAMPLRIFHREELPWPAAFLAGKVHLAYRRRGGTRLSTLPDFFIGAHAIVAGYRLLTRDAARHRRSFPTLELITPS